MMLFRAQILVALVALVGSSSYAQNIIVIRHGESVSNVDSINNGSPSESVKYPLTELGKKQVMDAASKLKAEHKDLISKVSWVYVSPLERTKQTADILLEGLGISHDKKLIDYTIKENGFGDNEGKKANHALNKDPKFAREHFAETNADVSERVAKFLARVKKIHPHDTVLVVTHGSPMVEIINLIGDAKDKNMNPANAEFRVLKAS